MKTIHRLTLSLFLALTPSLRADVPAGKPQQLTAPFSFSELGAKATADYQGDAIGITTTAAGAQLRTGFQNLTGTATREGLWLTSTETGGGRLRMIATAIGRGDGSTLNPQPATQLAATGVVAVREKVVAFTRPGLTEEYSVSVDGLRQDFVIAGRPAGAGDLRVELAVTGARAEVSAYGAKLTLAGSRRELAYSRLHVVDAKGQELAATLEVLSADHLAVRVADADATYPVRIDPTFSDADWVVMNPSIPGTDNPVRAIAVDGSGTIYIGGSFSVVGTVAAKNIAKWNGSTWSALGSGLNGTAVYALLLGPGLIAGGDFGTPGALTTDNIARWNGSSWSALGSGLDGTVRSLAMIGPDLYVGGDFTSSPGHWSGAIFVPTVFAERVAKWNFTLRTWSPLGSGMNNTVHALAVSDTDLYAGGGFTTAGGVSANRIAKWNGSAWSAMGSGMTDWVYALAVSGTDLYAGGNFGSAGGVSVSHVAKWNGSAWSALGSGVGPGNVRALAVSGTDLYVGGAFTTAGDVPASRIAKWNGSAWSALATGITPAFSGQNTVYALAVGGTVVYAAGDFQTMGGVAAMSIAKWNGSTWSALASGMNRPVSALALSSSGLIAGGIFTTAGGVTANRIAKWNGTSWSALGSGLSGDPLTAHVAALAVRGSDIYAGGVFTTAGGIPAANIAKWNGFTWSALGSGIPGVGIDVVRAVAVSGSDLYVGGFFTTAGGVTARGIAKWNGSTWSALGSGLNGNVFALAVSGPDLFAGGNFASTAGVGGVAVNNIAKWDGSAWSALGSGMPGGTVNALAVSGTDLFAGGNFFTAGGVAVNAIAKWDGSAWSALGSGLLYNVYALAVSGTDLYAGGDFHTAGGVSANGIAKWDGSAWSAVGSGMSGWGARVNALLVPGPSGLFVGGSFNFAGTTLSPFIVGAIIGNSAPEITCPAPAIIACTSADGALATVTVDLGDADSDALTVTWTVNSVLVATHSLAAGATSDSLVSQPFGFGPNTVSVSVTDGISAPVTCETTVTVTAHDAPVPSVATLPAIIGECAASITEAPTATDVCAAGGIVSGTTADLLSYTAQGSYTVTWTYTDPHDATLFTTQPQLVVVNDATPPVISAAGADATIDCPAIPVFTPPTVTDNCDPAPTLVQESPDTITPGTCPGSYTQTRRWHAVDAAGLVSPTVSQTVTVQDATPPVISAAGADASIECSATPIFTPPTAIDNCDPTPLIVQVSDVTMPGACAGAATRTKTWHAVDACGNTSGTVSQTITVQDNTGPMLVCPDNQMIPTGPGPVTFSATATDACDPAPTITFDPVSGSEFPLGITLVTCRATDHCGNTTTCEFSVAMTSPGAFVDGSFCTFGQGAFGNAASHGSALLSPALSPTFSILYPSGVTLGHVGNYQMTITTAPAIVAYLPASGAPAVLTGNLVNPTTTSAGVFGGQVLALRLSRDLSTAGVTPTGFGSVTLCNLVEDAAEDTAMNLTSAQATALNRQTINQVLADAENVLGGSGAVSTYGMSVSQLNALVSLLTRSFEGGFTDGDGFHHCGGMSAFARAHLCP